MRDDPTSFSSGIEPWRYPLTGRNRRFRCGQIRSASLNLAKRSQENGTPMTFLAPTISTALDRSQRQSSCRPTHRARLQARSSFSPSPKQRDVLANLRPSNPTRPPESCAARGRQDRGRLPRSSQPRALLGGLHRNVGRDGKRDPRWKRDARWFRVMSNSNNGMVNRRDEASSYFARRQCARWQTCHPRDASFGRIRDRPNGRRMERSRYPWQYPGVTHGDAREAMPEPRLARVAVIGGERGFGDAHELRRSFTIHIIAPRSIEY